MGLFRAGMSFITWMATQAITPLKTLRWYCLGYIPAAMQRMPQMNLRNGANSTLTKSEALPQRGTAHLKAGNGTVSTDILPGKAKNRSPWFVNSAEKNLKPWQTTAIPSFAQIIASRQPGGQLELTMKRESVGFVESPSEPTSILLLPIALKRALPMNAENGQLALAYIAEMPLNTMPVKSVNIARRSAGMQPVEVVGITRRNTPEPVYNLEVEDAHEFFANGVLVHNCLDALRYLVAWLVEPMTTEEVWSPWQRIR